MEQITKDNYNTLVAGSNTPILLDFWAPWCGPCRMIAPLLEEIAEENPDYRIGKINVDEEGELAGRFGIVSIPTLVLVRGDQVLKTAVGYRPKEEILDLFQG